MHGPVSHSYQCIYRPITHALQVGGYSVSDKFKRKNINRRIRIFKVPRCSRTKFSLKDTIIQNRFRTNLDLIGCGSSEINSLQFSDFSSKKDKFKFPFENQPFSFIKCIEMYRGKWLIYKGNSNWSPLGGKSLNCSELISELPQPIKSRFVLNIF